MEINRNRHLQNIISCKHSRLIKVITGVRRSGKSYLLFNLFYNHLKECGVAKDHIIKVDLEDIRNSSLYNPYNLLAHIDSQMKDKKMYYILLDEVQNVENFVGVLNSYLKIPNADVYATGSNSKFLSKDIVTEFRGRSFEIKIAPLSFSEFYSAYKRENRQEALARYMRYGGMPELFSLPEDKQKTDYLKGLFNTTYLKDIKARYHIENDVELGELVDVLASSIGGLINPTKIEHTFKTVKHSSLSQHTIQSYLSILEESFLVEKAMRYDVKGRRYIGTPSKYYFSDLGLRNARINFRQQEMSHLMENLIYNELRIRGFDVDVGVVLEHTRDTNGTSQRKQLEVDFVCNKSDKRCYVQSAFQLPTMEKRMQELRSLNCIGDSFPKYIITEGHLTHYNDDGVVYLNLYDFLLNEDIF